MLAVIYRLKLQSGKEQTYQKYWRQLANYYVSECGALGSCLHKTDDGLWVAYSRWPDQQTREIAWPGDNDPSEKLPTEIRDIIYLMRDCVEEKYPDIVMNVVDDLFI